MDRRTDRIIPKFKITNFVCKYTKSCLLGVCVLLCMFFYNFYLEQILYKAIICDLEYRGFRVLVDGYNDLTVLHSCKMLDGP